MEKGYFDLWTKCCLNNGSVCDLLIVAIQILIAINCSALIMTVSFPNLHLLEFVFNFRLS